MSRNDLATYAMDAHGGLERWNKLDSVTAHLLVGGGLWPLKGKDGVLNDVHVTVDLRDERASHSNQQVKECSQKQNADFSLCSTAPGDCSSRCRLLFQVGLSVSVNSVSGRSKPARSGRIKTSHFEVR